MPLKKWQDYIKTVDFSDFKVLAAGIVLLVIPLIVLVIITDSGKTRKMSRERLQTMVNRKRIFNFAQNKNSGRDRPAHQAGSGAGAGWFAEAPEKQVKRELEEAFKVVQQSSRTEHFPMGATRIQKQAYRAEQNPFITDGNGYLELGKLAEAEKMFEKAFDQAGDNVFLKVHALGGLCEVYERRGDRQKFQQTFELFMEWVAKLPPEAGGGDLKESVRNAYKMLAELKNSADPSKFVAEVSQSEILKRTDLTESQVKEGLDKTLAVFPARFDD